MWIFSASKYLEKITFEINFMDRSNHEWISIDQSDQSYHGSSGKRLWEAIRQSAATIQQRNQHTMEMKSECSELVAWRWRNFYLMLIVSIHRENARTHFFFEFNFASRNHYAHIRGNVHTSFILWIITCVNDNTPCMILFSQEFISKLAR